MLAIAACATAQGLSYAVTTSVALTPTESSIVDDRPAQLRRVNGLLLVRGELDGTEGYLIVDTGSPGLVLNAAIDHSSAFGELSGATGTTAFAKTEVKELRVAGLRQLGVPALQLDMSYTETQLGVPLLGLIGYQQLSAAPVEIRLSDNELRYRSNHAPALDGLGTSSFSFTLLDHLPVLQAELGDQTLALAFDSGSSVNLIDESHLLSLKTAFRGRPATRTLAGVDSHPVEVPCALVSLTFVDQSDFHNRSFLFVDLSDVRTEIPELSGLLSPSFWDSVDFTIDYQGQRLVLH